MKKILLIAVALLAAIAAQAVESKEVLDSLQRELAAAKTSADSIDILYNLFDAAPYSERADHGERLLSVARRSADGALQRDVMRRLASIYTSKKNDKRISELADIVASMPVNEDQQSTLTYLRIQTVAARLESLSETERQRYVHQLIKQRAAGQNENDTYARVELLFTLCRYLQSGVPGETLAHYIDELDREVASLPHTSDYIRNTFYVQESIIYAAAGMPKESVKAARELLKVLDELVEKAKAEGRKFRSYDTYYYQTYRRILQNYEALTPEEVEDTYAKVLHLVETNRDVAADFNASHRPEIYYLMAKKDYAHALPLLKKYIGAKSNAKFQLPLNTMMLEAATALNDREAMLQAALVVIEQLQKSTKDRLDERRREIEILKEIQSVQDDKAKLEQQNIAQANRYHHSLYIGGFIIVAVLLGWILVLFLFYRRARRLSTKLAESNELLTSERDALQHAQAELVEARDHARRADRHKTEFISNMSHEVRTPLNTLVESAHLIVDTVDDEKQKYLQRYANIIDVSADMIQTLVNDVLEITELEHSEVDIESRATSINRICSIAVDTVQKHCKPGVEMNYLNASSTDVSIRTDARRVEQVLINLLNNGAKFTDRGHVNLSYELDPSGKTVTFAVEDTGIGVPPGKEEVIFERFEKLSSLSTGTGLGLNISRMIADLLHGSIRVDTTYAGPGARFLFTIPV